MNTSFNNPMDELRQPINSVAIYVLAIIGILFSWCCAPITLVLAIIAVVMSVNKMKAYKQSPNSFRGVESLKNAQIIAYISLGLNLVWFVFLIYNLSTGGLDEIKHLIEQEYNSERYNEFESYD